MQGVQAVIFERPGQAETVLVVRDVPSPIPRNSQVLICIAAMPIHPADLLFIEGRYRAKASFPQVAGLERVGTIVASGPEVTDFEPRMRFACRAPGAWGEFAAASVSRVYPVPPEIPDSVVCQFALNPLTARELLTECKPPKSSVC